MFTLAFVFTCTRIIPVTLRHAPKTPRPTSVPGLTIKTPCSSTRQHQHLQQHVHAQHDRTSPCRLLATLLLAIVLTRVAAASILKDNNKGRDPITSRMSSRFWVKGVTQTCGWLARPCPETEFLVLIRLVRCFPLLALHKR
jgi:hypothetical protein